MIILTRMCYKFNSKLLISGKFQLKFYPEFVWNVVCLDLHHLQSTIRHISASFNINCIPGDTGFSGKLFQNTFENMDSEVVVY